MTEKRKKTAAVSVLKRTHKDEDFVREVASRLFVQRCGGGRRIIRKKIKGE